eukprot:ANDGO_02137.mRNA.1 hypothetical protein
MCEVLWLNFTGLCRFFVDWDEEEIDGYSDLRDQDFQVEAFNRVESITNAVHSALQVTSGCNSPFSSHSHASLLSLPPALVSGTPHFEKLSLHLVFQGLCFPGLAQGTSGVIYSCMQEFGKMVRQHLPRHLQGHMDLHVYGCGSVRFMRTLYARKTGETHPGYLWTLVVDQNQKVMKPLEHRFPNYPLWKRYLIWSPQRRRGDVCISSVVDFDT